MNKNRTDIIEINIPSHIGGLWKRQHKQTSETLRIQAIGTIKRMLASETGNQNQSDPISNSIKNEREIETPKNNQPTQQLPIKEQAEVQPSQNKPSNISKSSIKREKQKQVDEKLKMIFEVLLDRKGRMLTTMTEIGEIIGVPPHEHTKLMGFMLKLHRYVMAKGLLLNKESIKSGGRTVTAYSIK